MFKTPRLCISESIRFIMASFKYWALVACILLASVLDAECGRRKKKCRMVDDTCTEVVGRRGDLKGVGLCAREGGACMKLNTGRREKCSCLKVDQTSVIVLF